MPYDTTIFDRLQASVSGAEEVLNDLDLQFALLDAKLATIGDRYQQQPHPRLMLANAGALVEEIANGRAIQWTATYKYFRPNPATPIAAIIYPAQVIVWECDARGHLHTFLGIVSVRGWEPANSWRTSQEYARRIVELHDMAA